MMQLAIVTNTDRLIADLSRRVTQAVISSADTGPSELRATIRMRSLAQQFKLYDGVAGPGSAVRIEVLISENGIPLWRGRLEDVAVGDGTIKIIAYGDWKVLKDTKHTALWSDTSVAAWETIPETVSSLFTPQQYTIQNDNNRLFIGLQKGTSYGNSADVAEVAYRIPHGSSRQIVGLQFTVNCLLPNNWNIIVCRRTAAFALSSTVVTMVATGSTQSRSFHLTFSGIDCVSIEVVNVSGGTVLYNGETGEDFVRLSNLRVVTATTNRVNTVTTATRTNGTGVTVTVSSTAGMYVGMQLVLASGVANSEIVTVLSIPTSTTFTADVTQAPGGGYVSGIAVQGFRILASEMMAAVVTEVATTNPVHLLASTNIPATTYDYADRLYEDAEPATVLSDLAELEGLRVFAQDRSVFLTNPATFTPPLWYADVASVEVARSLNNVFNRRYTRYKDASGRTLRTDKTAAVANNQASQVRWGVIREAPLDLDTTSSALVASLQAIALADSADPAPRLALTLRNVMTAFGMRIAPWRVLAGHRMVIRNLSRSLSASIDQIANFTIARAEYDLVNDELTVEAEIPPDRLDVKLAQLEAGI